MINQKKAQNISLSQEQEAKNENRISKYSKSYKTKIVVNVVCDYNIF